MLLAIRYVPESRNPEPGSFDLAGAVLSTAGFVLLIYAIIEAPDDGWLSGTVLGVLAASVALLAGFLWWESHVAEPMLDLGFFRSARFSVGTTAIGVAFFALLGGSFALTQYLQFAHGYSAIQAGAIMSPMTLGLIVGAGSSNRVAERVGTAPVVAAGLAGLGLLLAAVELWSRTTAWGWIAAWFFLLTLAMSWVMAPATDAVVGAVPAARSGVASATNTVVRMVAGALGVAIVGSLVSSLYSDDVDGKLGALPPQAREQASSSIGAANVIAGHLPGGRERRWPRSAATPSPPRWPTACWSEQAWRASPPCSWPGSFRAASGPWPSRCASRSRPDGGGAGRCRPAPPRLSVAIR